MSNAGQAIIRTLFAAGTAGNRSDTPFGVVHPIKEAIATNGPSRLSRLFTPPWNDS